MVELAGQPVGVEDGAPPNLFILVQRVYVAPELADLLRQGGGNPALLHRHPHGGGLTAGRQGLPQPLLLEVGGHPFHILEDQVPGGGGARLLQHL